MDVYAHVGVTAGSNGRSLLSIAANTHVSTGSAGAIRPDCVCLTAKERGDSATNSPPKDECLTHPFKDEGNDAKQGESLTQTLEVTDAPATRIGDATLPEMEYWAGKKFVQFYWP